MLQNDLFAACGLSVTATTMDAVNGLLRKVRVCARSGSTESLTRKSHSGPRANAPHVQWTDHVPFPRQRRSEGVRAISSRSSRGIWILIARRPPRRMSSMDAEEKLVLNHIRDAGNMGARFFGPTHNRTSMLIRNDLPRDRNLESDFDDQDGLASRDDRQGAQGPRGEKDHQDGQVGQGECRRRTKLCSSVCADWPVAARLLLEARLLTLPRSSLPLACRLRLAKSTCSRVSRLRSS